MHKISPYLLIAYCLLLIAVPAASAQTSFSITPPRNEISLLPGQEFTGKVKITNTSTETMKFSISSRDFVVSDQNQTPVIVDSLENPYSLSSWITVYNPEIEIPSAKSAEIQYVLQIPPSASPGGHYGMLIVEPHSAEPSRGGPHNQANVFGSIGSLLYVTIQGDFVEKAKITTNLKDSFQEYGPINLSITVKNLGNVHIKPILNITLYNNSGERISFQTLEQKNIFPKTSRNFNATVGSKWMMGQYKIKILGSYGQNNNLPLEAVYSFWIIPWRLLALGLVTLIGLGILVYIILRR